MSIEEIQSRDLSVAEIIAETRRIMDETTDLFRQAVKALEGETE